MRNIDNIAKINMQGINNINKSEIPSTISTITDKMNSNNIYEVWKAYKSMHGLKKMDAQSEREILTLLQVNNLNPFKKEAYIIPFNGRYTVVVAYQKLLIRAYEAGYSKYSLEFKEEMVKTIKIDSKGNKIVQDDWQCTAYLKSDNGDCYSFSVLFNEYYKNTPIWREKPTFMLRKCAVSCLCRTLPGAGLESMPYIREELGDIESIDEIQSIKGIEYAQTGKMFTKDIHSFDYESVTKSNNMPFNLSIESEVDNDASTLDLPRGEDRDVKEQAINADNLPQKVISENVRSSNNTIPDNKVVVNKEKANSIKFNGYRNMLIAARSMHNYLKVKPFDSIDQIDSYLSDIEIGSDAKLLEHFSRRKELKSIKYWITLIRDYITINNSLKSKLEQFNAFIAFKGHLYENSTIKLFSFLSGEIELQCLFENYEVDRVAS